MNPYDALRDHGHDPPKPRCRQCQLAGRVPFPADMPPPAGWSPPSGSPAGAGAGVGAGPAAPVCGGYS